MHISLNNEWILIIQTPLFSRKIEFLSDVKIFEKSLYFKNGLLYLFKCAHMPDPSYSPRTPQTTGGHTRTPQDSFLCNNTHEKCFTNNLFIFRYFSIKVVTGTQLIRSPNIAQPTTLRIWHVNQISNNTGLPMLFSHMLHQQELQDKFKDKNDFPSFLIE